MFHSPRGGSNCVKAGPVSMVSRLGIEGAAKL